MKYIYLIALLILSSCFDINNNDKVTEYNASNIRRYKTVGRYENGLKQGVWHSYDKKGRLTAVSNYIDGKMGH